MGPAAPTELASRRPASIKSRPATGLSRVVCFTPRHDLTLAELPGDEVVDLLGVLQDQYRELARTRAKCASVLMFENKGEVVGVSNPHPHCQIYATNLRLQTIEIEARRRGRRTSPQHGRALFQDIIDAEEADGRRMLASSGQALSFVPYFARYPYETYVAPRETHASIADLTRAELEDFAAVLRETLIRLDNLWRMPFPYVMVLHQAPVERDDAHGFHFHIQIHPPLRKPGLLKYLAGPEIGGGNFLNDTAPEAKAAELQAVSDRALQVVRAWLTPRRLLEPILALHDRIRDSVVDACEQQATEQLAAVAAEESSDTIYRIDRVSEEMLVDGTRGGCARTSHSCWSPRDCRRARSCCRAGLAKRTAGGA